jgi:glycosyltransferase involved in cell wall biosynthesis
MNVLVAQLGARRHYAVPAAFARHGYLGHFCTDFYVKTDALQVALQRGWDWTGISAFRRLAGRHASEKLGCPISTFWWPRFSGRLAAAFRSQSAGNEAQWMATGEEFARACSAKLSHEYNAVYSFSSASYELFERAQDFGLATWLDHATAPRSHEMALVRDESERFPGWALHESTTGDIKVYEERQRAELALADVVICGSSFAKQALLSLGVESQRLRVVPLGFSLPTIMRSSATPHPRREGLHVLFVGGEGLRKGIGYLAQALSQLRSTSVVAKAAGNLELSSAALAVLAQHMELLGPVPRSSMGALFEWADVLVLPSVSETFGIVILEAMAHGLPVIATEHTGAPDVVREGIDGFVLPIRAIDGMAERIQRLAEDRSLLDFMKQQAKQRATEFTGLKYAQRLIAAVSKPSDTLQE